MTYAPSEDEIRTVSVSRPMDAPTTAIQPQTLRLNGPECGGCDRHGKAAMLSYTLENDETIYDVFLDAERAESFLHQIEKIAAEKKGVASLRGDVVLSFERYLGEDTISLRPDPRAFKVLMSDIGLFKDEITQYIEAARENPTPFVLPRRAVPKPRTEASAAFADSYYKHEPTDVPLRGTDAGSVLAALYNNAKTGGSGVRYYQDRPMTPEEGRHILSEIKRIGAEPNIDYINGRSVKAWFRQEEGGDVLAFTRFWDYNDIPASTIIAHARQGKFGRLEGQDILDIASEVTKLTGDGEGETTQDPILETLKNAMAKTLKETQKDYVSNMSQAPDTGARTYQLSISNGPGTDEIGDQIRPFRFPTLRAVPAKPKSNP